MPPPIGGSWKFPGMASIEGGNYQLAALGMAATAVNSPVSLMSLEMLHATSSAPFLQSSAKLEHCSLSIFHALLVQVLYCLATQSVVHESAALESLGSLLEREDLGPHPRPTKTDSGF